MTRRQKISLAFGFIILLVILLSQMVNAQYQIESVSGSGYKRETRTKGYVIILEDSTIVIYTDFDRLVFEYQRHFFHKGTEFFNLNEPGWQNIIIERWGNGQGIITLDRFFRTRPPEKIVYKVKKL
jgi:hypothetical protein